MYENMLEVTIRAIQSETETIKRFTLSPANKSKFPSFSPGSHITTYINGDKGLIARPYSLIGDPNQTESYEIAIRLSKASRGGSKFWHKKAKVGDKLKISYPKNHFALSFRAKHHVFYAAGIGITPFISMMSELKDCGISFELHFAAKSIEQCAFYQIIAKKYGENVSFYFSNEGKRLQTNALINHPIGTHVYICGPDKFISEFVEDAIRIGYPKSSIHFERFTAAMPKEINPFEVRINSGTLITVSKEQTLLEALLMNGIKAPYSCRVGRCGSCEIKVLEGEVAHYDQYLSEEQRNNHHSILSCISRAKSRRLTIDL
jgi:dimethylamine monooxygenase subunit B